MSDRSQRTEKPTERRIDKSRREGRFASSREFVAGVQFLLVVWAAGVWGPEAWYQFAVWFRGSLAAALDRRELSIGSCVRLMRDSLTIFLPLTAAGAALAATGLAAQFSVTRFGWSAHNLTPDLSRLNPGRRLREIYRQNVSQALESIALLPLLGFLVWAFIGERLDSLLALSRAGLAPAIGAFGSTAKALLWEVAIVLFVWGVIDLIRQKKRHFGDLRMTKQEVRDEAKETDGNPQLKSKIRRLRGDLLRPRMVSPIRRPGGVQ